MFMTLLRIYYYYLYKCAHPVIHTLRVCVCLFRRKICIRVHGELNPFHCSRYALASPLFTLISILTPSNLLHSTSHLKYACAHVTVAKKYAFRLKSEIFDSNAKKVSKQKKKKNWPPFHLLWFLFTLLEAKFALEHSNTIFYRCITVYTL